MAPGVIDNIMTVCDIDDNCADPFRNAESTTYRKLPKISPSLFLIVYVFVADFV